MSAQPTNKTSTPPTEAVWWLCTIHGGRTIHVKARLWIDARKEAARQVGCAETNVLCLLDRPEAAELRVEQFIHSSRQRSENSQARLTAWTERRLTAPSSG